MVTFTKPIPDRDRAEETTTTIRGEELDDERRQRQLRSIRSSLVAPSTSSTEQAVASGLGNMIAMMKCGTMSRLGSLSIQLGVALHRGTP